MSYYVRDINTQEFEIIYSLLYTFSDVLTGVKGKITFAKMSDVARGGSEMFRNIRMGCAFSKKTVSYLTKNLYDLVNKYGLINSKIRTSIYASRHSLIRYIHDYRLYKNTKDYHDNWNKDFPSHCYHLILDSMGINIWSEKNLPDTVWVWLRHHITFNKESNDPDDLALVEAIDHARISHPGRLGPSLNIKADQQKLLLVKQMLKANKRPTGWRQELWDLYQNRRTIYERLVKQHGQEKAEIIWFKKYYPLFYTMYQNQRFWNTHKL